MSQAKVEQYKKEKANRKETIAKEKRQRMIMKICASVILVAMVAWVGISTADFIYESRPQETVYVQTTEIDNYLDALYAEETTEQ